MLRRSIALAARRENSQFFAAGVVDFPNLPTRSACKALRTNTFIIWHGSCSEGSTKLSPRSLRMSSQETQVALPLRSHTILGVCEAIGEDFGFNPTWLRVPFAASVLLSPTMAVAAYLAVGLVVLASRLLFPKVKAAPAAETVGAAAGPVANDANDREKLPIAA
jgi:phage shock protein C